jgi:uncharacterized protein
MRISEAIIPAGTIALALLCAGTAAAFEVKEGAARLPQNALPVVPPDQRGVSGGMGVERGVREALQGFFHHYKSGDKSAAIKQLEIAAAKGDVAAQWRLARLHADGDGVPVNDLKAFQLFSRIANARADESRDSPHAGVVAKSFVALGAYWLEGIPNSAITPNPARAMEMFHYAASYFGDPDAQYHLARIYLNGLVGKADPMHAARWLNLASEKGHMYARAVLGQMLINGEGLQRQVSRGLMWLTLAREQADTGKDAWVVEAHEKALTRASEDERRQARAYQSRQPQPRQVERR